MDPADDEAEGRRGAWRRAKGAEGTRGQGKPDEIPMWGPPLLPAGGIGVAFLLRAFDFSKRFFFEMIFFENDFFPFCFKALIMKFNV